MAAARGVNFRFAEFELRREALELTRSGERIRLQIVPYRVLELLLERAGEVVTREEFRARVWASNVYIDFDHGLNNAIARLREVLGDTSDSPRFIETLHRIGYRFVHPVERIEQPAVPVATDSAVAVVPAQVISQKWSPRTRVIGVLLVAAAAFGGFLAFNRGTHDAGVVPIRSVAVMPFRNLSEDGGQDYFAAGMTEALITRLAQNPSLRVVSRRAAASHQDDKRSVAAIARELEVDGVIDGAIVRDGGNLRIDVQLLRAADESHVWARSYQRSVEDVFRLQAELAQDISREIDSGVSDPQRRQASLPHSDNIEAYELYLQGRHLWNQRSKESVGKSLEYFRKAIELDPDFAAAHAGLAQAYTTLGGNTMVRSLSPEEIREPAMAAAQRAVELDPALAEAHSAMAAAMNHFYPRSQSTDVDIERELQTALKLNPASAEVHHGYANFLSTRRRSGEAILQWREALKLDPLSPNIISRLGQELAAGGQIDEGFGLMRRAIELEPWQFNAHLRLGLAYAALDRHAEATSALATAEQISPNSPQTLSARSYVAARSGDRALAAAALGELRAQADRLNEPFLPAIVYVGLQDKEGALAWLEKCAEIASPMLRPGSLYGLDRPMYDWLRDDHRFQQISQSVKER